MKLQDRALKSRAYTWGVTVPIVVVILNPIRNVPASRCEFILEQLKIRVGSVKSVSAMIYTYES